VPAVTEVCAPQLLHCHTCRAWCIAPTSPPPHRRQQNPSGQRQANRYSRHASSEAKRSWNSMIVTGNPGLGIPSSYDPPQTEKIGYANVAIALTRYGAVSGQERSPARSSLPRGPGAAVELPPRPVPWPTQVSVRLPASAVAEKAHASSATPSEPGSAPLECKCALGYGHETAVPARAAPGEIS
jgi:hypothetical protein